MSVQQTQRVPQPPSDTDELTDGSEANFVREMAEYVSDITRGVRRLTTNSRHRDLLFLDYLLAIVEDEAAKLTAHSYH